MPKLRSPEYLAIKLLLSKTGSLLEHQIHYLKKHYLGFNKTYKTRKFFLTNFVNVYSKKLQSRSTKQLKNKDFVSQVIYTELQTKSDYLAVNPAFFSEFKTFNKYYSILNDKLNNYFPIIQLPIRLIGLSDSKKQRLNNFKHDYLYLRTAVAVFVKSLSISPQDLNIEYSKKLGDIIPDAIINDTLLLEMDMGTEDLSKINDKFVGYTSYFSSCDMSSQVLIFITTSEKRLFNIIETVKDRVPTNIKDKFYFLNFSHITKKLKNPDQSLLEGNLFYNLDKCNTSLTLEI